MNINKYLILSFVFLSTFLKGFDIFKAKNINNQLNNINSKDNNSNIHSNVENQYLTQNNYLYRNNIKSEDSNILTTKNDKLNNNNNNSFLPIIFSVIGGAFLLTAVPLMFFGGLWICSKCKIAFSEDNIRGIEMNQFCCESKFIGEKHDLSWVKRRSDSTLLPSMKDIAQIKTNINPFEFETHISRRFDLIKLENENWKCKECRKTFSSRKLLAEWRKSDTSVGRNCKHNEISWLVGIYTKDFNIDSDLSWKLSTKDKIKCLFIKFHGLEFGTEMWEAKHLFSFDEYLRYEDNINITLRLTSINALRFLESFKYYWILVISVINPEENPIFLRFITIFSSTKEFSASMIKEFIDYIEHLQMYMVVPSELTNAENDLSLYKVIWLRNKILEGRVSQNSLDKIYLFAKRHWQNMDTISLIADKQIYHMKEIIYKDLMKYELDDNESFLRHCFPIYFHGYRNELMTLLKNTSRIKMLYLSFTSYKLAIIVCPCDINPFAKIFNLPENIEEFEDKIRMLSSQKLPNQLGEHKHNSLFFDEFLKLKNLIPARLYSKAEEGVLLHLRCYK